MVCGVVISAVDTSKVHLSADDRVMKKTTGGTGWVDSGTGRQTNAVSLAIDVANPSTSTPGPRVVGYTVPYSPAGWDPTGCTRCTMCSIIAGKSRIT